MARYKEYCYEQTKLIPLSFSRQILPGTFEYTLNYLIDNEFDLSVFEERYHNDETGAPAYDPAILLKIVLYGYSRGIVFSRQIERCCRENIIFMALSADTHPHFTTIADFISSSSEQIIELFRDVLLICDEMGLIGREMFAIDGCKLGSNASKEWSGTKGELKGKQQKMERAVRYLVEKHREMDAEAEADPVVEREQRQIETLRAKVKGTRENFQAIGAQGDIFEKTQLTADAGFHTEQNMKMLFEERIDGYVADILFRKRDPRFKTADQHKPKKKPSEHFTLKDFIYDSKSLTCICPAGKRLYL